MVEPLGMGGGGQLTGRELTLAAQATKANPIYLPPEAAQGRHLLGAL